MEFPFLRLLGCFSKERMLSSALLRISADFSEIHKLAEEVVITVDRSKDSVVLLLDSITSCAEEIVRLSDFLKCVDGAVPEAVMKAIEIELECNDAREYLHSADLRSVVAAMEKCKQEAADASRLVYLGIQPQPE